MYAIIQVRACSSSSTSLTAPLPTNSPNVSIPPGSFRRSHEASVKTGQQVKSGARRSLSTATQRPWASSRARTMATRGPVSTTARSVTAKAFHVFRVGGEVRRGLGSGTLEAANEAGLTQHIKSCELALMRRLVLFERLTDQFSRGDRGSTGVRFDPSLGLRVDVKAALVRRVVRGHSVGSLL